MPGRREREVRMKKNVAVMHSSFCLFGIQRRGRVLGGRRWEFYCRKYGLRNCMRKSHHDLIEGDRENHNVRAPKKNHFHFLEVISASLCVDLGQDVSLGEKKK